MNYYIYVLQSQKDQKYYIGQTSDLENRIIRHNKGAVPSTKSRRPLMLIYQESFTTRGEAMQRENYMKSLHGSSLFRKIIGETRDIL